MSPLCKSPHRKQTVAVEAFAKSQVTFQSGGLPQTDAGAAPSTG